MLKNHEMNVSILHAGAMRNPATGVIRQMEEEQAAAQTLGIDWDTRLFYKLGEKSNICIPAPNTDSRYEFKRGFYTWLKSETLNYDALLLRYAKCDPLQTIFIRQCKIPVFTVHHTLELQELIVNRTPANRLRYLTEKVLGPLTLKKADGIIGITKEMANYNLKRSGANVQTYTYPNGAAYAENCVIPRARDRRKHELLIIASKYSRWIGFDLLLDAVRDSKDDFTVHVVGELNSTQIEQTKSDCRFITYGLLSHAEIHPLISRSSVGIGSLALFRNGMKEGNTLKVKEYLRAGLPVYAGYQDVFPDTFPYYRNGPVNMEEMLAFCEIMRKHAPQTISDIARPYIEKSQLLKKIHNQIGTQLLKKNQ